MLRRREACPRQRPAAAGSGSGRGSGGSSVVSPVAVDAGAAGLVVATGAVAGAGWNRG